MNNKNKKDGICMISSPTKKDKSNGYKNCLSKRIKSIQVIKLYSEDITKDDERQMCSILREIDPEKFSTIQYRPDYEQILKIEKDLVDGNMPENMDLLFLSKTQLLKPMEDSKLDLIIPVEVYVCGANPDSAFCKLEYDDEYMRKQVLHNVVSFVVVKYITMISEDDYVVIYRLMSDGLIESMYYEDNDGNKVPFLIPAKCNKIIDFIDGEDIKKMEKLYGKIYTC